jgi:hypothetical protein
MLGEMLKMPKSEPRAVSKEDMTRAAEWPKVSVKLYCVQYKLSFTREMDVLMTLSQFWIRETRSLTRERQEEREKAGV